MGVPQGSILGPILLLIYINDLPDISDLFHTVLYADDTTVSFSQKTFSDLFSNCNIELDKLKDWFICNRLSVHLEKTFYIIVTNQTLPDPLPNLVLNNRTIERRYEAKFLGVILDQHLKFESHTSYISNKISKSVGIMYRIRNFIPRSCLSSLYYSFIYSYLFYCNLIWGNTYNVHLYRLRVLQKRAIRIMHNQGYLAHTNGFFLSSKILKLTDMNYFIIGCHMYKYRNSYNLVTQVAFNVGILSGQYCVPLSGHYWESILGRLPIFKKNPN